MFRETADMPFLKCFTSDKDGQLNTYCGSTVKIQFWKWGKDQIKLFWMIPPFNSPWQPLGVGASGKPQPNAHSSLELYILLRGRPPWNSGQKPPEGMWVVGIPTRWQALHKYMHSRVSGLCCTVTATLVAIRTQWYANPTTETVLAVLSSDGDHYQWNPKFNRVSHNISGQLVMSLEVLPMLCMAIMSLKWHRRQYPPTLIWVQHDNINASCIFTPTCLETVGH